MNFPITIPVAEILEEIHIERKRQDKKWGEQNHSDEWWYLVLGEEFGEVGEAILKHNFGNESPHQIKKELIQVAAVALAWLECMSRRPEGA